MSNKDYLITDKNFLRIKKPTNIQKVEDPVLPEGSIYKRFDNILTYRSIIGDEKNIDNFYINGFGYDVSIHNMYCEYCHNAIIYDNIFVNYCTDCNLYICEFCFGQRDEKIKQKTLFPYFNPRDNIGPDREIVCKSESHKIKTIKISEHPSVQSFCNICKQDITENYYRDYEKYYNICKKCSKTNYVPENMKLIDLENFDYFGFGSIYDWTPILTDPHGLHLLVNINKDSEMFGRLCVAWLNADVISYTLLKSSERLEDIIKGNDIFAKLVGFKYTDLKAILLHFNHKHDLLFLKDRDNYYEEELFEIVNVKMPSRYEYPVDLKFLGKCKYTWCSTHNIYSYFDDFMTRDNRIVMVNNDYVGFFKDQVICVKCSCTLFGETGDYFYCKKCNFNICKRCSTADENACGINHESELEERDLLRCSLNFYCDRCSKCMNKIVNKGYNYNFYEIRPYYGSRKLNIDFCEECSKNKYCKKMIEMENFEYINLRETYDHFGFGSIFDWIPIMKDKQLDYITINCNPDSKHFGKIGMTIDKSRSYIYKFYMLDISLEQLIEKIGNGDFADVIQDNHRLSNSDLWW